MNEEEIIAEIMVHLEEMGRALIFIHGKAQEIVELHRQGIGGGVEAKEILERIGSEIEVVRKMCK